MGWGARSLATPSLASEWCRLRVSDRREAHKWDWGGQVTGHTLIGFRMVSRPSNRGGGQISGHSLLFGLVGRKWWGASFWPLPRIRLGFSVER